MNNLEKIISQLDNLADNPVGTYQYIEDLELSESLEETWDNEADYNAFCDYAEQCGGISQC